MIFFIRYPRMLFVFLISQEKLPLATKAFTELYGYTEDFLVGKNAISIIVEEFHSIFKERIENISRMHIQEAEINEFQQVVISLTFGANAFPLLTMMTTTMGLSHSTGISLLTRKLKNNKSTTKKPCKTKYENIPAALKMPTAGSKSF
ncbi:MAG: PAS domain S-box protein [Bacteroidales bacterium]